MIPRFSMARPRTMSEAFAAFGAANGEAAWLAGGTELLQVMKMGFAQFAVLVDLKALPDLRGITIDEDGWLRIGAATTHRDVERSGLVRERMPALAGLARQVANVRVRNTGTLGGNLAFAEPHSDPATFLLGCGATVLLQGPGGARELTIDEFVLGPLFTAREPDEILVAVRVPPRRHREGHGYARIAFFERPAASVGVRLEVQEGAIMSATVAVGSVAEAPQVLPAAGQALVGVPVATFPDWPGVDPEVLADVDAVEDLNGSADYKRYLAAVLLARAARAAIAEVTAHA